MITVLYVDDEAGLLEITKLFLEKDGGFSVDTAISAKAALASASIASCDAIVSDYQMPGMDGIAFLKVIRERFGDIPFILFTGRGREEIVIDAINNGADFYIQKGGDPRAQFAELSHKIRQAVRRKQAERSLFDSERRLADIIDFLPDATFAIDTSGKVIAWNRAIEEMTGVPAGEMLGKGDYAYAVPFYGSRRPILIDLIDAEDKEITPRYTSVSRTGATITAETSLPHPGGHQITVLTKVCHLYNQAGEITGTIESIRDITGRKRTEEALRANERRLASIYDTVNDSIFHLAVEPGEMYRFSSVNPAFCRVTGIPWEAVVGRLVNEIIPEPSLSMVLAKYRQAIAEKTIVRWEETSRYPTGQLVGEVSIAPVCDTAGACTHLVGSVHDITERKRLITDLERNHQELQASYEQLAAAEEELRGQFEDLANSERQVRTRGEQLRASEAFLNSIIDQSPNPMWISDAAGTLIRLNPACRTMLRITDEDVVGKYNIFQDNIVEEQGYMPLVKKVFEAGEPVNFPLVYDSAKLAGLPLSTTVKRVLFVTISPIKSPEGRVTNAVIQHKDITEQDKMESALRESQQQLEDAMDLAGLVNWEYDLGKRTFAFDNRFFALAGTSAEREGGNRIPAETYAREFLHPDDVRAVAEEMEKAAKSTDPEYVSRREHRIVRRDGGVRHVLVLIRVMRDEKGRLVKVHGTMQDLTEQKRTEESLRENQQKLRAVLDNLPDLVLVHREGIILYVNPAMIATLGIHQDEVLKKPVLEYIASEYHTRVAEAIRKRIETGRDEPYEIEILPREGGRRTVLVRGSVLEFDGSPATITVLTDITERKSAQEALFASEEKFRSFVENANDIIYSLSADGIFTYVSPNCNDLLWYGPDEIIGQSFEFITHPDDLPRCQTFLDRAIATGKKQGGLEHRVRHKDGTWRWYTTNASIIRDSKGTIASFLGIARDITDRKKTEEALRESEEKFRSFVENANDILFSLAPDGTTTYVSPKWTELLGHDTSEIIGKPVRHIHPEDFPRVREFFNQILTTGKKGSGIEYRIHHKDGTWQWHTQSSSPVCDAAGRIVAIQGICHDITKRKQAEEDLWKSRQLLAGAMDIAHMANWEFDARTGLFTFDDRFYALYGTTTGREGGSRMSAEAYVREFVHPDDRDLVYRDVVKALQAPGPRGTSQLEHRIIRRDGVVRNMIVRIGVTRDAEGRPVKTYGANQDITDRKNVEKALSRANRQLTLLGSVTRHDIINKISIILGYLRFAEMKFPDPELAGLLKKIESNTRVIQSEMEFTRTYQDLGTREPQWIDLDTVMPRSQVPPAITLNAGVQGISVFADPMLEKVFSNLLDNSIRHGEKATEIRISSRKDGRNLVVAWEDNGVGISAGEKEKIFERGYGKHTGLGMFLAREILALTGITITETGEPGTGARFEILIPDGMWRGANRD